MRPCLSRNQCISVSDPHVVSFQLGKNVTEMLSRCHIKVDDPDARQKLPNRIPVLQGHAAFTNAIFQFTVSDDGYAIISCDEFSCPQKFTSRDTINWTFVRMTVTGVM